MGVFCERDRGERMDGFGVGRDVKCGFWARAVRMAVREEGGVMRCMSGTMSDHFFLQTDSSRISQYVRV